MVDLHSDAFGAKLLPKWLLPTLLGACLVIFGLWGRSCYLRNEAKQQAAQSDRHDQAGIVHAAQGELHDQQADAKAPTLEANDARARADAAEVARLRAEVSRLRKAAAPVVSELQPLPPSVLLDDAKDQLIDALTKENDDLKTSVVDLKAALAERTAASTSWKAAYGESQKALACLRIAHEAQLAAIKAERWKGRIEGFAVGLGSDYVTGRLR